MKNIMSKILKDVRESKPDGAILGDSSLAGPQESAKSSNRGNDSIMRSTGVLRHDKTSSREQKSVRDMGAASIDEQSQLIEKSERHHEAQME